MRFDSLTRHQLGDLCTTALVVIPVGACEQHGPHLPVGTDSRIVQSVADAAATRITSFPVLTTPVVAMGNSDHHVPFGGTITVSTETLERYLFECCHSLVDSGFSKIFLLNGHGGNVDAIGNVARRVSNSTGHAIAAGSYWTMASDAFASLKDPLPGLLPGHAGAFETSLALALFPELCDLESAPIRRDPATQGWRKAPSSFRLEDPRVWALLNGYTDDPHTGNAEVGRRCFESVVSAVCESFEESYSRMK